MGKFFYCKAPKANNREPVRRKMVIVGDGECGKTCLVTRMSTGSFVDNGYLPTVFETETLDVDTGDEQVELVIYDTAGQEDYNRLRPLSYHDVDIAVICFSLAEPDTLTNVRENWSPEIRHFCGDVPVILVGNKMDLRDPPTPQTTSTSSLSSTAATPSTDGHGSMEGIPKSENNYGSQYDDVIDINDLKSSTTTISSSTRPRFHVHAPVKHSEGILTAKRIGAMAYFETSALTGENAEELLLATTKAAVLGTKKSKKFKSFTDTLRSWRSIDTLEQR